MKLKIENSLNSNLTMIKYIFSSGICFVVDQLLFNIIMFFLKSNIFILISKILARVVSSILNYIINSRLVFNGKSRNALIKYYLLVLIQVMISGSTIYVIKLIFSGISTSMVSIIVDIIIFIINYLIQKNIIFINK